ncbi:hypothetical protein L1049_018372 [Liquidambar formosana]|uniref:RING-type E3 ubiquitin transferase n=1 Tax=Liquidambar formosana TaxID=63359 RepID=A0AAP0WLK5_LIQFO
MALVSPVPAIPQQIGRVRFNDIRVSSIMATSNGGIVEEPVTRVIEDKLYVAVGKDVKESKSILMWALQNSGGRKICLIHVYQPAQMIPLMGGKFPVSTMQEQEVRAYRELEKQNIDKILNEYLHMCNRVGARAEKEYIEMDSIEKGIVELITQRGITKLVIGAAADKHYSRRMMELKSKKALYVRLQAPLSCQIWFICKGHLIYTREGSLDGVNREVMTSSLQASPNNETGQSNSLRSRSITLGPSNQLTNPVQQLFRRAKSVNIDMHRGGIMEVSSPDSSRGMSTPQSRLDTEGSPYEWDEISMRSTTSHGSGLSRHPSSQVINVGLIVGTEESTEESELNSQLQPKEDLHHLSPPSVLEGSTDDKLYYQLEQAMAEAENARREAFEETVRRGKAEKDAIEAIRRAKAAESLYAEDLKQRKEIEEALVKEKQELEEMKNQRDEVMEELQIVLDQKSLLESQIADSEKMAKELEEKIISAVELLQNYKKERDELQIERDNVLKVAEELRRERAEGSSTNNPQFFSEFSFLEIEEATSNFHPTLKIGEGGYGSIYKGLLRHTEVAIKMLHSHSLQGPSEFQQEVDVLSKLRHPNLVTLIGACPEAWTLIYEYLPNGSLEDRLCCKDNSPPLSWQTRIRIAAELCSVLIFLHSNDPNSIVHGDLKPANILLDANFISKLSDFGICRIISDDEYSSSNMTVCHRTDPKGTFVYMDPEFLQTGELTTKSDVYSFGIILLRLLTGRPPLGITKEVQYALDNGNLKSMLDYSAGDWPYVQAQQLAHLALRCSELKRRDRPDLGSEVWRVLEAMRASCGASSSFRLGSEDLCQAPPYFICPIFQSCKIHMWPRMALHTKQRL